LNGIAYWTVGSRVSANKPNSRENRTKGTTSGSSDPSDEDDELGPCEQSTNPLDIKRLRRYKTNTTPQVNHKIYSNILSIKEK
jgi:hypothetical protein